MPRLWVMKGDKLILRVHATTLATAVIVTAHLYVRGASGRISHVVVDASAPTNRTPQDSTSRGGLPEIGEDSEVVGATISADVSLKRGQVYAQLYAVGRGVAAARTVLCRGYVYASNQPSLGFYGDALGGKGYLSWVQEGNDVAGNVATTVNLAATNTRRIIHAVIIKYHQTGGAAATITITLRDLADSGGPTNWSIESDTWVSPDLVLAANQEGLIHVGEHGFLSTNDAGVLAYADNTTAPNPFPLVVDEGDPVDLLIAASGGASGDDYDVWVQYEEWAEV